MNDPRYDQFPEGFFDRQDPSSDRAFYASPRLVTHIDDGAIAAVGALYEELEIGGDVLDMMSSWISHFASPPARLIAHGMNGPELTQNVAAIGKVVSDLNATPVFPFADASFDASVCTVSVDYLSRPIEVFDDLARIVRPGGRAVFNFSNRVFPTKAIQGWLSADDLQRCGIVSAYFQLSKGWSEPTAAEVQTSGHDPLFAVWAERELVS